MNLNKDTTINNTPDDKLVACDHISDTVALC